MKIYITLLYIIGIMFFSLTLAHGGERGTWVVRFDIDTPEKVKAICSPENQRQFDRYLVQVRGRADSWYESSLAPRAEGLEGFDPLGAILEQCTDVEVHAWLNVYYLWTGDTPPKDLDHPYYKDDWILRDRTGRSVKEYSELEQRQRWIEGVYADPASREYRAYFTRVVRELVGTYDVAGVHLDFVRYPSAFFGDAKKPQLPKLTRQKFAEWVNGSGDDVSRGLIAERLAWDQTRSDHVTGLVRDVKTVLADTDVNLKLSASVFPDVVDAFLDKGQKWSDWLKEGLLDEVFVMAYFGSRPRILSQISQCQNICDRYGVRMWAGLGAYIKSPADIRAEIVAANGTGTSDFCLFSLGHLLKQKRNINSYQCRHAPVASFLKKRKDLPPLVKSVLLDDFRWPYFSTEEVNISQHNNLKLRGIFRYVDTHDDYVTVQHQYEIMQKVQQKLQGGASFVKVSREYSQAGTKRHGGVLPDLVYRDVQTRALQGLFNLNEGELSEIIAVHNGFWIFNVLAE